MSTVIIESKDVDELEFGMEYQVAVYDSHGTLVINVPCLEIKHIRTGESALLQSNDHESDSSGPEGS